MLVKFVKYEGAGNDFILIDDREGAFRPDAGHIAALCDRHFGIGADGLMTLRRSAGLSVGADLAVDPLREDLSARVREAAGKSGADVVIECVGNTAATRSAFEAAGFGATVLLFSVPAPTATVPLPLFDVYKKELAIRGSFINPDTHLRAVELLSAGRINVEPLITHTFGIGEMEQAIKMQMGGESIKVMVLPNKR